MLRITIDIFSGRPNPSWDLEGDQAESLLRDVALNRAIVAEPDSGPEQLGYRGVLVEALTEGLPETYDVPPLFKIANGASLAEEAGIELARRLVREMPTSEPPQLAAQGVTPLTPDLHSLLEESITLPIRSQTFAEEHVQQHVEADVQQDLQAMACGWEAYAFSPSYWNDPSYIRYNNCYNFATGRRTNTFAQPGRYSGHQILGSMLCPNVQAAAQWDGARRDPNCAPSTAAPRFLTALVVWPGWDYHWYRRVSQGYWAHKPGQTPAKITDQSNRVIYNPYTANRGPYTHFCGWFYCPSTMRVR